MRDLASVVDGPAEPSSYVRFGGGAAARGDARDAVSAPVPAFTISAVWATVFLVGALALIESFEPKGVTNFELQLTGLKDAGNIRPRVEQVLARYHIEHSLRTQSDEALSYEVKVPLEIETDRAGCGERFATHHT